MNLWVLGSGSRGNAVLIEAEGGRLLVDAGFPPTVLASRLAAIGVAPDSIDGVVLTHEHTDHARGVVAGSVRWGWAVYATPATARAAGAASLTGARDLPKGTTVALPTMDVQTFSVAHDAADPVGVVVTARRTGARAAVVHDLGVATPDVRRACAAVDILVLEANHDEGMLRAGPYPSSVKQRIAGRKGHLSNRAAAGCAREVAHRGLAHVVLAHLSEVCNAPAVALRAVSAALAGGCFSGSVHVTRQDEIVGPFAPARRAPGCRQLTLML
ncbi:MAG: MBL fold metallo-hydrolase [Gemmatimonadaceae bacterium]